MSVEAMALVLHHSRSKGTAKLVLLGIANHEGDGGAWPSIATLAKYANCDPRSVQRAIRELAAAGELRVKLQSGGLPEMNDYLRPNRYDVTVSCPEGCDGSTRHKTARPGDASVTGSPDASVTPLVTPTSPKPSSESSWVESADGHRVDDSGLRGRSQLRSDEIGPTKLKRQRNRRPLTEAQRSASWHRFSTMDLGELDDDRDVRCAAWIEMVADHGIYEPDRFAADLIAKGEWDGFCSSSALGHNRSASWTKAS